MPNRIFRSETGFHPLEALASFAAFSKPAMGFCCAYARGSPSAAVATLTDCIKPRRDTRFVGPVTLVEATDPEHDSLLVVAFESVFIFQFYLLFIAILQRVYLHLSGVSEKWSAGVSKTSRSA